MGHLGHTPHRVSSLGERGELVRVGGERREKLREDARLVRQRRRGELVVGKQARDSSSSE